MASWGVGVILLTIIAGSANATPRFGRTLTQTTPKVYQGTPSSVTVSAANPNINAITITPIIPYPQNAYFCNVTGDSRIPQQGPFPLTVYVPVGVTSTVIFANVTGPIPGTTCTGANVVQQQSTPGVVQQQTPSSVVQQQQTPSSVVQQQQTPSSVVQQQTPSSVVQQQTPSSVVQQQTPSSVVQQQTPSSVVQQQTPSSVVQQQTPSSVVQQQGPSSSVVQQQQYASINQQNPNASQFLNCVGNTSSVVQQGPTPSVVQQPSPPTPPSSVVQQQQSSSVVKQPSPPSPPSSVVQQQQSSSVVQQKSPPTTPSSVTQSSAVTQSSGSGSASASASASGRHLLQAGTIEYISNNGSSGQPQLTVLDTVEGVPRISFAPTDPSQTAVFNGALQVAVTTTHDGFGQPYIPYQVDSKLSPQCNVQVIFKAVAASAAPSSG